jgi:hypothetical protein
MSRIDQHCAGTPMMGEAFLCKATISAIGSLYKPAEFAADDYRIIFGRHRMIFEAAASQKLGNLPELEPTAYRG